MNSLREEELLRQKAEKFERELSKYPIEVQITVNLVSKNILNGCSWELTRNCIDIERNLSAFKNSKYCRVYRVNYNEKNKVHGYLVYMKLNSLIELLQKTADGLLNMKDIKIATNHRQEACLDLANKMKKGYKGVIGIFCTNDSQTITVQGKTFPAYAITLNELCQICQKVGYGVEVNGKVYAPEQIMKKEEQVIGALTVAPSSNALFIKIAPMR